MNIEKTLELALENVSKESYKQDGFVIKIVDLIVCVYGLSKAVYGEVVHFQCGALGVVFALDEYYASVAMLNIDDTSKIREGSSVVRTGTVFKVGVSEKLLSRVVDATGTPCDFLEEIEFQEYRPIERQAPSITNRAPINSPLKTGITVIDALIPIGKGQRELILGDRSIGKTSIALDTIINQKDKNVICVYVSIGNKQSGTAKVIKTLDMHGALEYTVIVQADAYSSPLSQFFAPYTGCTIAEFFMDRGRDVLIVYDDLSNHAIAYRELSLLLRRPPGREAFPGDIFYIHSRLLERACKLSKEMGGGSMTALPIVQTQGDDISAYIPTNVISITDGQIILDSGLFNKGTKPAINIGASVSRVGATAQNKAMKKVSTSLKLDVTNYEELSLFAQFGSELDKKSLDIIDRGKRAIEIMKQSSLAPYTCTDQVLHLFLLKEGFLDSIKIETVTDFAIKYASYTKNVYEELYKKISDSEDLTEEDCLALREIAFEFSLVYSKEE